MRIAFIYHFDDQAWAGGKNYFASLFSATHQLDPSTELVLITGTRTQTKLPQEHPYLKVVRTSMLDRKRPLWILRQALRLLSGRRYDPLLGGLINRLGIDVLSHSQPSLSRGSKAVSIAWLPDFQFLHLPHLWSATELAQMQKGFEEICRNSDGMIVSSQDAQRDLHTFAPWYDKPVHVLHFCPQQIAHTNLPSEQVLRERYDVQGRYAFLPNQFWAHKNHQVVIDALHVLKSKGEPVTVLCTGKPLDPRQPEHFAQLMVKVKEFGLEEHMRVLGVVPYADMLGLMHHAHVVINPSRFEGWSTTVEEGKSMGKRMILSDIGVHREQDAPFAAYFDKDDPDDLARVLAKAMSEPAVQVEPEYLERQNRQRCAGFAQAYANVLDTFVAVRR